MKCNQCGKKMVKGEVKNIKGKQGSIGGLAVLFIPKKKIEVPMYNQAWVCDCGCYKSIK